MSTSPFDSLMKIQDSCVTSGLKKSCHVKALLKTFLLMNR